MLRLGLYVITHELPEMARGHLDVGEAAVAAGADVLQLRAKDKTTREMVQIAARLAAVCRERRPRCVFLVNDRVDIALAAGADGVHVGDDDMPVGQARAMLGPYAVIGASAWTLEQAMRAEREGADYIGAGPIFATPTKPDAAEACGLSILSDIAAGTRVPVVAIGGIDAANADAVMRAGADGIAVVSAVAAAPDMERAARELRDIVRAADSGRGERA
ncbi:MAG: thiamine phosphate synthase [Candidatus Geothermincolia bacterium]